MTPKSRITTEDRRLEHRLPKHRPPTHPGEMLLEEFLKPLAARGESPRVAS